jgi:hypothetical protein
VTEIEIEIGQERRKERSGIMCYVQWGTVGAAMLTASTLTFAAPNGETFNYDTNGNVNDDSRNGEMRDSEARTCSEIAAGPRQLRLRMLDNGMNADALAIARGEVTAIWKQYGVEIVWEDRWTSDRAKPDVWVQFVDIALTSKGVRGAPAVAWIPFAAGVPMPYVRVSKPNAAALLATRSWFDHRPLTVASEDLQNQALGRIIGRAVAHEIGHFLLASRTHTPNGLMRAILDPEWMVNPGTEHFKLRASDVRALRAARIASCEMALRQ